MANAAEFRKGIAPLERAQTRMESLMLYIKGQSSLCLAEILGDASFSELSALEQESREATKAEPTNIKLRQVWLFFASLKRDAQYGYRGINWLQQVGLNGLIRENYDGAKVAVDAEVKDA
jgi:hypothetical protein